MRAVHPAVEYFASLHVWLVVLGQEKNNFCTESEAAVVDLELNSWNHHLHLVLLLEVQRHLSIFLVKRTKRAVILQSHNGQLVCNESQCKMCCVFSFSFVL